MKNLIFHEKTELFSGKYIREDQFNVHLETLIVYDDQVQSHDPLFPILHRGTKTHKKRKNRCLISEMMVHSARQWIMDVF